MDIQKPSLTLQVMNKRLFGGSMKVKIEVSSAQGTVKAPASKSMAHRLMICGLLAEGKSVITDVTSSEDVLATIDCARSLGADISYENNTVTVNGTGGRMSKDAVLPCRECGSTLRFFVPICLAAGGKYTLTGSTRLMERPLGIYEEICEKQGCDFKREDGRILLDGQIKSGDYHVAAGVSSQFISGLLFSLPMLDGDSKIYLEGKIESRSYIDLTVNALKTFGIQVSWLDERTIDIPGNQKYQARNVSVEGDYSNAAFLDAFNYIGGQVKVDNLLPLDKTGQGDRVYGEYFEKLKAGKPTLSLKDCPDLGPIMFAMAGMLGGAVFTETERLRIKESDRIEAMKDELEKVGIQVVATDDKVEVISGELHAPKAEISGHNDHRIVMAMAVLLSKVGGVIDGAQAVEKSMPDFFERIRSIGVNSSEV